MMRCLDVLVLVLCVAPWIDAEASPKDGWILNDLARARARAKKTGKPMLVVLRCEP